MQAFKCPCVYSNTALLQFRMCTPIPVFQLVSLIEIFEETLDYSN